MTQQERRDYVSHTLQYQLASCNDAFSMLINQLCITIGLEPSDSKDEFYFRDRAVSRLLGE